MYLKFILALSDRPGVLECYECDPTTLLVRDPSKTGLHATRKVCLTDDTDFGELKQCNLVNGLCAKGTIGKGSLCANLKY